MVQEAYAIVIFVDYWKFHLLRAPFIVSTDNRPIATIFSNVWKDLSSITQKQLRRLRAKLGPFAFESYHVKGINNPVADALSRFTLKIIKEDSKLPPQQQQHPLELSATSTHDINEPKLTKQELIIWATIMRRLIKM